MAVFEKLIEALINVWERLAPFVVVQAYEGGVILRFGKYHRTLPPGIHWKIPFAEDCINVNTCVTTMRLPPQTLTTKDNAAVVCAAVIKYQIRDPRPFVTDVWDQRDVLADVTMGAIRGAVIDSTYEELVQAPPEARALAEVRRQANQYGFKIHSVTFTDLGRVKSIRLIQPHGANLDN